MRLLWPIPRTPSRRPAPCLDNADDPGTFLRTDCSGLSDDDLALTSVTYLHQLKATKVVGRLHRLRPVLGCSARELDSLIPLLLHLEALVYRGDLTYEASASGDRPIDSEWCRGVERVLAAHRLDSPAMLDHLASLEAYAATERLVVTGAVELGEDALRKLTYQRCSDVRMLIRVLCDSVGDLPADVLLHVLDPLLALREIIDDLRTVASDRSAGTFNILEEYIRLFGASRGPVRLYGEQRRLIAALLHRWADLPRRKAAALWPTVFDFPPVAYERLLRTLPKTSMLRLAMRRLLASVPEPREHCGR